MREKEREREYITRKLKISPLRRYLDGKRSKGSSITGHLKRYSHSLATTRPIEGRFYPELLNSLRTVTLVAPTPSLRMQQVILSRYRPHMPCCIASSIALTNDQFALPVFPLILAPFFFFFSPFGERVGLCFQFSSSPVRLKKNTPCSNPR